MKRFVLIVLVAIFAMSLAGCDSLLPYGRKHTIFLQVDSNWVSEDETISIHVNDDGMATMIMDIDGDKHTLELGQLYSMIYGYYLDEPIDDDREEWNVFYHRSWFRIKVSRSKFFEKGTKIRFNKVEE